jgi:hypothetical protein
VADWLPADCWAGPEFWRLLTGADPAGAQVYRLVRELSQLRHADVYRTMRPGFNPWDEDIDLAVDMLTDQKISFQVTELLDEAALGRLKDAVVSGQLRPTRDLWAGVREWDGDYDLLGRRVQVAVFAKAKIASSDLKHAVTCLLAPVVSDPTGREVLEAMVAGDSGTNVGDVVDMFAAACVR